MCKSKDLKIDFKTLRKKKWNKWKKTKKMYHQMKELIEKIADQYAEKMQAGESVGMAEILEELSSAIMKKERDYFLGTYKDNANGFYLRDLQLALGKLYLKVSKVRLSKGFRSALLPEKWKMWKNYEQILIALLSNSYSSSQIERSLKSLDLPYSKERIDELTDLVKERLDAYKKSDLPESMFAFYRELCKNEKQWKDRRYKHIYSSWSGFRWI